MKITIFLISLIFMNLASAGKRKTGETKYKAQYQSSLSDCKDFKNEAADARDLHLNDEDNSLHGKLDIGVEMSDGVQLELIIFKVTDQGNSELVASFQMGLCEAMKQDDAPWTPVFEQMGITECPIKVQEIDIPKLVLDISWADDFMSHDYVGEYFVVVTFSKVSDDPKEGNINIVCYDLYIGLIEYKEESEEEE